MILDVVVKLVEGVDVTSAASGVSETPLVVRDHGDTGIDELPGNMFVSATVFGDAVDQDQNSPRSLCVPAPTQLRQPVSGDAEVDRGGGRHVGVETEGLGHDGSF
jgi:hypothetical protein